MICQEARRLGKSSASTVQTTVQKARESIANSFPLGPLPCNYIVPYHATVETCGEGLDETLMSPPASTIVEVRRLGVELPPSPRFRRGGAPSKV